MRMLSLVITFASAFAFAACEEPDAATENALIEEALIEESLAKESLAKESPAEEPEGGASEDNGMDGLAAPVTQDPSKYVEAEGNCCTWWIGDIGHCENCKSYHGGGCTCRGN